MRYSVYLDEATTFRELIGFNSGIYIYSTSGESSTNTFDTVQNIAQFDSVKYVYITCNLVNGIHIGKQC